MLSDYISKSALKEKIITIRSQAGYGLIAMGIQTAITEIENAPTLDLVPAPVRCGECDFYKNSDSAVPNERFCKIFGGVQTDGDDFCSHGKRKEQQK